MDFLKDLLAKAELSEAKDQDKDFMEVFDEYCDAKSFHHWEGDRGYRNLTTLVRDMGDYSDINHFLADNSGAIEAIIEWLREQGDHIPEWKEGLEEKLPEEE